MKNRIIILIFFSFFTSFLIPDFIFAEEPLTLEASINIALKNSFIIHSAKEGVAVATAQKREAITGFLPKFNTSYSYQRLNEPPFTTFVGLPPTFPIPNGTEITVGTQNNYNWTIEARQPLFTGGALIANYQASKIGEEAARMEETAKVQDIIQDVKISYYDILRAQRINDAERQSVEMLSAHRDDAQNFFNVGLIPKNDLLHAEVELANGKQAHVRAQNSLESARVRFNTILKRKIFAPVAVVDTLGYKPFEMSMEDCFTVALKNRPELKIAELKARQAGKMVSVSKSEYWPAINLVGNYTRFGDNPSVSGSDFKDAENWYVMGTASWNFWEWGKTKYRVDASRARENQALDDVKEWNDQIALQVKNAYLVLRVAEKQIAVSEKVIEQAEENFRIAEERFKEQIATTTEVLDAQTLLTRAKSDYANALGEYNISLARLQRIMGTVNLN